MLDRSKLGSVNGDGAPAAPSPAPAAPPVPPAPEARLMATGLPNWDLEPPAVLIRRPGT